MEQYSSTGRPNDLYALQRAPSIYQYEYREKNIYYAVSFATNREKANEQNKWNGGSA